jgi:hypothetical protein
MHIFISAYFPYLGDRVGISIFYMDRVGHAKEIGTRILSSPRGEDIPHQEILALHFEMEDQDFIHFWGGV